MSADHGHDNDQPPAPPADSTEDGHDNPPAPPEPPAPPADSTEDGQDNDQPPGDGETFPREYVERLRTEAAQHRRTARDAAEELHGLRVQSLGILADPTDLPFDPELSTLDDVRAAAESLVERKPHLRARRVAGDIGQHRGSGPEPVSLLSMMRQNA